MPKSLLFIFLISLLMQFVCISLVNIPIERDAGAYYRISKNLALGKGFMKEDGYPALYAKPLYCLLLAGIFLISWNNIFLVKFIQAILIAFACLIVYRIGEENFNRKVGFWSGFVTAIYPPFWIISSNILPESLFIILLSLSIYALVRAHKEDKTKLFIYSGIFFGLSTQARPTSIFLPFLIFLLGLPVSTDKFKFIKRFMIIFIITIGCVLPWTIRNYKVFGISSPALEFAEIFWIGTYTKGAGNSDNINTKTAALELRKDIMLERNTLRKTVFNISKLRISSGLINLKRDFRGYISLFPIKFIRLWVGSYSNLFNIGISFTEIIKSNQALHRNFIIFLFKFFNLCLSVIVLFLGLAGMFLAYNSLGWKKIYILVSIFFYFSILHMILISDTKYGLPALPYLIIFSIFSVDHLLTERRIRVIKK